LYRAAWYPGCGLVIERGGPHHRKITEANAAGHTVWELVLHSSWESAQPVQPVLGLGFRDGDWNAYNFETVRTRIAQLRCPEARTRRAGMQGLGVLHDRGVRLDEALPELVKHLGDADAAMQRVAAELVGQGGAKALLYLPGALTDPNPAARASAVPLCQACGMPAKELVPILARALRDKSPAVQQAAAGTAQQLGKQGASLVPALRELVANGMDQSSAESAVAAAQALGDVARDKRAVEPILYEALTKAKAVSLRCTAAGALTALHANDPAVVDALFSALGNRQSPELRSAAMEGLGVLAKDDARLVPALRVLLRTAAPRGPDWVSDARMPALAVLGTLGRRAAPAIPELQQIACDPKAESSLRTKAIEMLGSLGRQALGALAAVDRCTVWEDRQLQAAIDAAWLKAKAVK